MAFADKQTSFVQATLYDKSDGLTVSEFNGGTQNTSEMIGPGQYAFATINGLTIVDFDKIPYNSTAPKISIEQLTTDGKIIDIQEDIYLPFEQNNIEITYTALSFTSPKNNQFKYQMIGYDKDWRDAGTGRKAVYTHLPPGGYTFMVIARNNDGVWNTEAKTLKIHIIPPFYLTSWFKILLFLTIIGAIFGLIVLIVRRIREKEKINMTIERERQQSRLQAILETEEAERKRIAEDLHDGIGPLISTVKLNLSMAEQQLPRSELILNSQNQIDSIANELRTITYNLVPTSLSAFGFVTAVQEFIDKLKPESRIQFYFEAIGTPQLESSSQVILFRVVQELINNSIKHSDCTEITMQLIQDNQTFRVMMEDNGKGFNLESGFSKHQSRGLKNITDRCKVLEAHLNFDSKIGRGTSVTIEIATQ
jgi:signal transduction histidine kinase